MIRTTVWTKHNSTIRGDEIKEEHDLDEIDESERRRRSFSDEQLEFQSYNDINGSKDTGDFMIINEFDAWKTVS